MSCGIYKITCKDTGQMYIGLSENIEKRWYNHIHSPHLKKSRIDSTILKHGVDKFDLEIIEELPNDRALLMEREEYWVAHTYENNFHYNLTPGGDFCPMKDPNISEIRKAKSGRNHHMYGRKHTPETREKISKANSGRKHTPKTKEKMSRVKNSSGYYRVYKRNGKDYRQGFIWVYKYYEDGKRKNITSVDIEKLEEKVRAKGLKWLKID